MITTTMEKEEVNREIIRLIPDLMKIVLSKSKHRLNKAKKKGFPDEVSSYDIQGVKFWVFYFSDNRTDVNQIFCRYHDNKGAMYAMVNVFRPEKYSIVHFLKHSIERYNSRLELGLIETKKILFHMAKHGLHMVRKDGVSKNNDWVKVGWKCQSGLWLGESISKINNSKTHVNLVRTFVNNERIRFDQEIILDDEVLQELIDFESFIGGDNHARAQVNQLLELFKSP